MGDYIEESAEWISDSMDRAIDDYEYNEEYLEESE